MNTALVKKDLLNSLKTDTEYRHAWNLENVYTGVCFQIRVLREQREWSQAALGTFAKMAQERISILEDPNADTKPTLNTLLRIADAFDVGLDVRFVPYKTVIDRSTHTDAKELEVPSFKEELPELERSVAGEVKNHEKEEQRLQFSGLPHDLGRSAWNSLMRAIETPSSELVEFYRKLVGETPVPSNSLMETVAPTHDTEQNMPEKLINIGLYKTTMKKGPTAVSVDAGFYDAKRA